MGTLVVLALLAVGTWVVWKLMRDPDKNDDGKVDVQDVAIAAKEVVEEVRVEAAKVEAKVEQVAQAAVAEVVEQAKKARKPRAKKAAK